MKDPKLNVRVPPDLDKQFELECVNRGLTKQAATASKGNMWITESQRDLGRKLAKQLRKDYQKAQKVRAGKEKPKG